MSFLVTKPAPDFTATAVLADNSFDEEFTLSSLHGKYVVLFFYPLDFTFVCPTEILAFDEALEDFRSRDAEVVGISVDSHYTHAAWKRTHVDDGGIGPIRYPLVSDLNKEIARNYGVLLDDEVALRGLFLIDRAGGRATRAGQRPAPRQECERSSADARRAAFSRAPGRCLPRKLERGRRGHRRVPGRHRRLSIEVRRRQRLIVSLRSATRTCIIHGCPVLLTDPLPPPDPP